MAEAEVFEARFAAAYRRYLAEVPTEVDALAIARGAARARPRFGPWPRAGLPTWPSVGLPARLGILLLVGLLIAALTAFGLMGGARPPEAPAILPLPAIPQPSAPGTVQRVFALSWDEAYAVVGDDWTTLWHFNRDRWEAPETIGGIIRAIAAMPDGRLAAATTNGVFVRAPEGWSATPVAQDVYGVVATPYGSLWAAGPPTSYPQHDLIQLLPLDRSWRASRTACPAGGAFLALASDGTVWSGGFGYNGTGGLARYDGQTCVAMSLPGGSLFPDVVALAAGPSGELAVAALDPPTASANGRAVLVAYDGTRWSTLNEVAHADGWGGPLGFDGAGGLWVQGMPSGLVRWHLANGTWAAAAATSPLGGGYPRLEVLSVARDGTFWWVDSSGILQRARP